MADSIKPKPKRKKSVPYHNAAYSAFMCLLGKEIKAGDITLTDERPLSKRPQIIDIVVIKKNREIKIETSWGEIFREHNIVEYKSPVDSSPTISVFHKVCSYAENYASQEDITRSNISATIVCYKYPTQFFKELSEKLDYEVSPKGNGIYYIYQKGVNIEKSLAMQIIVSSELQERDLVLKALKSDIDEATMRKALNLYKESEENKDALAYWFHVMAWINGKILNKIISEEEGMNGVDYVIKAWDDKGLLVGLKEEWRQEGMQQGMQQGMLKERQRIFAFLKSGHSLEEAEKKFAFA